MTYTEREKQIIALYKERISELEEKIEDLQLIIAHNADLDAKKLTEKEERVINIFIFLKIRPHEQSQ